MICCSGSEFIISYSHNNNSIVFLSFFVWSPSPFGTLHKSQPQYIVSMMKSKFIEYKVHNIVYALLCFSQTQHIEWTDGWRKKKESNKFVFSDIRALLLSPKSNTHIAHNHSRTYLTFYGQKHLNNHDAIFVVKITIFTERSLPVISHRQQQSRKINFSVVKCVFNLTNKGVMMSGSTK